MKRHLQLLATFVAALIIGLNPLIGPLLLLMQPMGSLFSGIQLLKSRILRAIQTRLTTLPPRLPIRIRTTLTILPQKKMTLPLWRMGAATF